MATSDSQCRRPEWRWCRTLADITYYVTVLSHLIGVGIVALGAYRAFRIRRALAQSIYRTRALSLGLVAALYTIVLITDLAPLPNYTDMVTATLITLAVTLPYFVFALLLFTSVDRTILVAIDMDLLQRKTLRWPQLRLPLYALMLGSIVAILAINPFLYLQTPPDWANGAYFVFYPLFLVCLGVPAIALFLGAIRTLENTIRRFVVLFGVALICFIVDSVLYNYVYYFVNTPNGQYADDLVIVAATFFLYLAITSLTPLGKVEPVEAAPAMA